MNFKRTYLITIILLAIFSISAISAEEIADVNNEVDIISSNIDVADEVISVDINEGKVIQANTTEVGGSDSNATDANSTDSNATDENVTDANSTDDNVTDENVTNSSIVSSDLTKYYKNASQYEATFYDNDGNPLVNQSIPIKINGVTYYRTTKENGTMIFSINLDPGVYVLEVANPVTNETATNTVTVLSTLESSVVVKSYRNDTQYLVNVLDGQGNRLTNAVVTFNINGVFYNRTSNASGVAKLNINLNPGKYIITAENILNGNRISNNITVLSTIEGKDVTKYYKNDTQYYANFTDAQGNPLANASVTFNINGVFYNRVTNANGTARLNINLNPGTYVITATNPVSKEQKSNTIKVLSTIVVKNSNSGGNVSIEYNTGAKFNVELHYKNGTLATNESVRFNINGVFYNRTSDDKGIASLTINLNPGDYIITSEFEGYTVSNLIKVRITPTVKLVSSTIKLNAPIQFYLHEKNSGNPITGQHYGILYYNGTTYGAYPDANGLVSFNQQLPAGSYLFFFGTIDDGYYSSILNGNTIKIEA